MVKAEWESRPRRRRFLRALSGMTRLRSAEERLLIGDILADLGERSFGWSLVLFGLLNLMPWPPGSNVVTGLPPLVVAVQMLLGYSHVRMPEFLTKRAIPRSTMRNMIARLQPFLRLLEKVSRPRLEILFEPRYRLPMALFIFLQAFVLFFPAPLSGWGPALTIFVMAIAMVERDGLLLIVGYVIGTLALSLIAAASLALFFGAKAITGVV